MRRLWLGMLGLTGFFMSVNTAFLWLSYQTTPPLDWLYYRSQTPSEFYRLQTSAGVKQRVEHPSELASLTIITDANSQRSLSNATPDSREPMISQTTPISSMSIDGVIVHIQGIETAYSHEETNAYTTIQALPTTPQWWQLIKHHLFYLDQNGLYHRVNLNTGQTTPFRLSGQVYLLDLHAIQFAVPHLWPLAVGLLMLSGVFGLSERRVFSRASIIFGQFLPQSARR